MPLQVTHGFLTFLDALSSFCPALFFAGLHLSDQTHCPLIFAGLHLSSQTHCPRWLLKHALVLVPGKKSTTLKTGHCANVLLSLL